MKITEVMKEGKSKIVYHTDDPELVVLEFKDESPVFEGKKVKAKNKSVINATISAILFQYLENYHVPNHFVKAGQDKQLVCKKLEMIPIEVVVRNMAAGDFCERFGLEEGASLATPVIELFLKEKDSRKMINEYHAYAFELANTDEMRSIFRIASKTNAVLRSYFERRNLKLVNFKLEFGRFKQQIFMGDELSLDSIRLGEMNSKGKLQVIHLDTKASGAEGMYNDLKEKILMQG